MRSIITFLFILLSIVGVAAQENMYGVHINSLAGKPVSLQNFQNKKLLILVCDAKKPDRAYLRSLDSLERKSAGKLSVLVLPALDLSSGDNAVAHSFWTDSLHASLIVAEPVKVRKGNSQHPLAHWLTSVEKNKRFGAEIDARGQLFVVNERGVVFARLQQPIALNGTFMGRILAQVVSE